MQTESSGSDDHDVDFAAFVRFANGQDFDAWGLGLERAVVAEGVGRAGQPAGNANVVAEHVLGGRDARREREVIDERREELRPRRPLFDQLRELGVLRLTLSVGTSTTTTIQRWTCQAPIAKA